LTNPKPIRPEIVRGHGAKVLALAVILFFFAVIASSSVLASTPVMQEKQSDAAAKPETTDPPTQTNPQPLDLADQVIHDVLTSFQRGIETQNLDLVMGVFDQQDMKDYAQFREQMVVFFRQHDSVKFRYQLLQATADKDLAFAIADIDMDADPSDILPTQQRRSTQIRFQLKRGPKGWRVIGLRPSDFFNQ
jgi:hypothetical protein